MIVIVGAGLSGLLVGYRLKQLNVPFQIIEARERIGGRIHTVLSANATPVEMGATWFGNQHIHLKKLLSELGIGHFEQFMSGIAFYQSSSNAPVSAISIPDQQPSYRLQGGTSQLIRKLAERVGEENIILNATVSQIEFYDDQALVHADSVYKASRVVLALPPKLWASNIKISPSTPGDLMRTALSTHTWMEESIKVALVYETPFWRNNNHSGVLFSNAGPITEFYDHSNFDENKYALCGFVHPNFAKLAFEERKAKIADQLANVFGREARDFQDYIESIWEEQDHTYSISLGQLIPHQNNGNPIYRKSYFIDRLFISSSETAELYPGYMEGAVVSASFTVDSLKLSEAY
ncbi:MAG: NAD(P)/FAD-dependent oxidoreductase, partial [Bacteroidota bacterium]